MVRPSVDMMSARRWSGQWRLGRGGFRPRAVRVRRLMRGASADQAQPRARISPIGAAAGRCVELTACTPWTRDAGVRWERATGGGGGGRGVVTRRTREHRSSASSQHARAREERRAAAAARVAGRGPSAARVEPGAVRVVFFVVHTLSLLSNKNQFTLCTGLQLQTTTQVISNPPPRPVESWPTPMPSAPRPTCRAAAAAARPFR